MIPRSQIVIEARSWLGTPYRHQGRTKDAGVDCLGLVVGVAHALGLSAYDKTNYGASPDPKMMARELRAHLDEIAFKDILPGDILWFRIWVDPQHLGIVSAVDPEVMMIHAYARKYVMQCVESNIGRLWRKLVVGCFRYRGIS